MDQADGDAQVGQSHGLGGMVRAAWVAHADQRLGARRERVRGSHEQVS
jgi:hypothetical protein